MDFLREVILSSGELLLQSILIGCALTLFVRLTTGAMTRYLNASTRYVIWLLTLLTVAMMPLLISVRRVPQPSVAATGSITSARANNNRAVPVPARSAAVSVEPPAADLSVELPVTIDGVLVFAFLWLTGALVCLLRVVFSYNRILKLKRDAVPAPTEARQCWSAVLAKFPCDREPAIRCTDIPSPIAVGYRRPMVLLPDSLPLTVRGQELQAILLHELAHVRRGDDYSRLLQALVRAVWFFHPAVQYISARLDLEREFACDDAVLAATGCGGREYARSLTAILEQQGPTRNAGLELASGAVFRRRHIVQRVRALLDRTRNRVPSISPVALTVVLACAAGFAVNVVDLPELIDLVDQGPGRTFSSEWTEDGRTVFFEVRGDWEITDDRDVFASLPAGTVVRVGEGRWIKTYFEFSRTPEGVLSVRYRTGKQEQAVDASLRRRGEEALMSALRDSGYGADSRAERLLDRGGVAALLAEVDQSRSDHIRSEYLKHLLQSVPVSGEDLSRVAARITRLQADHNRADLLLLLAERQPEVPAQIAVAYAARGITADHDKVRVIEHLLGSPGTGGSADFLRSVLRAIDSVQDSVTRADLLLKILQDAELSESALAEVTASAARIEAAEQSGRVLGSVAQRSISAGVASRVLRAASMVKSDASKADILVRLAATVPASQDYRTAVRSLQSDEHRLRVVRAMIERNSSEETARAAAELADTISADEQRAQVLVQLATIRPAHPQLDQAIRRSAARLASSEDYRNVVTALEAK